MRLRAFRRELGGFIVSGKRGTILLELRIGDTEVKMRSEGIRFTGDGFLVFCHRPVEFLQGVIGECRSVMHIGSVRGGEVAYRAEDEEYDEGMLHF